MKSKLEELKQQLKDNEKANDLLTIFNIPSIDDLTEETIEKQYLILNLNSHIENDDTGIYTIRNVLRENYLTRVQKKTRTS